MEPSHRNIEERTVTEEGYRIDETFSVGYRSERNVQTDYVLNKRTGKLERNAGAQTNVRESVCINRFTDKPLGFAILPILCVERTLGDNASPIPEVTKNEEPFPEAVRKKFDELPKYVSDILRFALE
jgi:hypothetical protein